MALKIKDTGRLGASNRFAILDQPSQKVVGSAATAAEANDKMRAMQERGQGQDHEPGMQRGDSWSEQMRRGTERNG
jgi:hypothetical protein